MWELSSFGWTKIRGDIKVDGVNHSSCFKVPFIISVLLLTLFGGKLGHAGEIHDAAAKGDIEKVATMLKANPDLVSSKDTNGWTPLNRAAKKGHKKVAELLLAYKADVNAPDNDGNTPLHNAIKYRRREVVEWLLENHADIEAKDKYNDWTALHIAAVDGYLEESKLLLSRKANPNAKGKCDATPLHLAAGRGYKEVVELLLANGAEVNAVITIPKEGSMTPLGMALFGKQKETADIIRQHGGHE